VGQHALADDVASVLRQIGVTRRPFHIVAHSRGAAVAASIASLYPERVESIVCYEPAGISESVARNLDVPVQLLCGTRSWQMARRVAERTAELISCVTWHPQRIPTYSTRLFLITSCRSRCRSR
jgi:pimeloyl-ACP methyl ester carboxylesterase